MAYKTIYTEVEVDVDVCDFDTDDLVEELEVRGYSVNKSNRVVVGESSLLEIVNDLYQKRRSGQDFAKELDDLIYKVIGRM